MSSILRMVISLLLVSILAGCASQNTSSAIDRNNYIVKFGIFGPDSFTLYEETTTIPMKYKDTGFSCGYSIFAKDKSDFIEYSVSYPPTTAVVGDEMKKASKKGNGMRGPNAKSTQGSISHRFGFDKGDPPGDWTTDIFINNQFLTSIVFKVTPSEQ